MNALQTILQKSPNAKIDVAMVLGSGLSGLINVLDEAQIFPYADLPGFPGHGQDVAGVSGHGRELVIGKLSGKSVGILTGREHYYEHANAAAMRVPLETMAALGAKTVLLTNSAGSLNPDVRPGELMMICDHVNYAGANPLIGESGDARFVNLVDAYDPGLRKQAADIARGLGISLSEGVYFWFSGPSFETPAEIRMAKAMGGGSVGMSTAPEVILARFLGLKVWACSGITNMGAGMYLDEELSHSETKKVAATCAEKFEMLLPPLMEAL